MTTRQNPHAANIKESWRKNAAALAVGLFILKGAKYLHPRINY
jgi:hypothetical protein